MTGDAPESGLGVRLGTHRVPIEKLTQTQDVERHGVFSSTTVAVSDLVSGPSEYRAETVATAGDHPIMRGWVSSARTAAERVDIGITNTNALDENVIGVLSQSGMPPEELVWSMGRWIGMETVIPGLAAYLEPILVVMPVDGLNIDDVILGPVAFTRQRELVTRILDQLKRAPARDEFGQAEMFAVAQATAPMLALAEEAAVPLIEAAADRLALESQYSLAFDPGGQPIDFDQAMLLSDPVVRRMVLVTGQKSRRTWMRSLDNPRAHKQATHRRVELPRSIDDTTWTHALRAWRRATRERDPLAAVGAIFEAIEFYTSGVTVPRLVTKEEMKTVRKAVSTITLSQAAKTRLDDLLSLATEPPLRIKLVAALEADRVPFSTAEIERLWALRDLRNDALHGKDRRKPDPDDLDLAVISTDVVDNGRG